MYLDGANMNAILGIAAQATGPTCSTTTHKTFSQPHGGSGPRGLSA
jgi:glycine cleavage system protein P-like pyridoxal-binding family